MPLEKSWLRIAAGATAGGILAFAFAALLSMAAGNSPRTANLAVAPETRQYQAQYLTGDDPIGLMSDVLSVTVP